MPRPKKSELPPVKAYRGLALPITRYGGDYFASKELLDLVWSSIVLILSTPIGTRIMLPEFGSRISDLLWEPNDEVLRSLAKTYIIDAIGRWEPRVQILDLSVSSSESTLTMSMKFLVKNLSGVYEGGFTVYRNEAFRFIEEFWGPIE